MYIMEGMYLSENENLNDGNIAEYKKRLLNIASFTDPESLIIDWSDNASVEDVIELVSMLELETLSFAKELNAYLSDVIASPQRYNLAWRGIQ